MMTKVYRRSGSRKAAGQTRSGKVMDAQTAAGMSLETLRGAGEGRFW